MLRAALAAGAVYGAGSVTPLVAGAVADGPGTDLEILELALRLERVQAAFYAAANPFLRLDPEAGSVVARLADDEAMHIDAWQRAIEEFGGTPIDTPRITFPVTGRDAFLALGRRLEDTAVAAYNGLIPALANTQLRDAALSIAGTEARHAALVALLGARAPAPVAFERSLPERRARRRIAALTPAR